MSGATTLNYSKIIENTMDDATGFLVTDLNASK